ncbi:MAG TPA: hypothetical protein VN647_06495 [Nitrospira sp.]|nr:hypothetical protein [Nitrospira sp.]
MFHHTEKVGGGGTKPGIVWAGTLESRGVTHMGPQAAEAAFMPAPSAVPYWMSADKEWLQAGRTSTQ